MKIEIGQLWEAATVLLALQATSFGWRDKFRDVADQAEQIASRVAEQGREVGNKMQEVAGNLKGAVDKSVKDQPMATLAMAAALGFVLGALWKK